MCSLLRLQTPENACATMMPGRCAVRLVLLLQLLLIHLVQVVLTIRTVRGMVRVSCLSLLSGITALAGPPGPVIKTSCAVGAVFVTSVLTLAAWLCLFIVIGAVFVVTVSTWHTRKLRLANRILALGLVQVR